MKKFAKLYDTQLGQILVILKRNDADNGEPELTFFFRPEIKNLGTCHVSMKFEDDYDGWENAESAFNAVTENSAIERVSNQIQQINEIFEDDE